MSRATTLSRGSRFEAAPAALPPPLVWTFDGPFERCLDDLDDSLRRGLVLIGDVARVAVLIDLSLPALLGRVRAGDARAARLGPVRRSPRRLRPAELSRACATCAPAGRSRRSSSPIEAERRHRHVHENLGSSSRAGHRQRRRPRRPAAARGPRLARARPRRDAIGMRGGGPGADALRDGADLGAYAPLIGAVRDELEHFVASHVRLHVVIAERDRFLLTSIGVRSPGGAEARELLQQFMREFRPEQVKRYLAREVIGRLPNAAVDRPRPIRRPLRPRRRRAQQRRRRVPRAARRPAQRDRRRRRGLRDRACSAAGARAKCSRPHRARRVAWRRRRRRSPAAAANSTSTTAKARAAPSCTSVVPGRRYVIGKDDACDLRVDGTYTSRRHAEIWLDDEGWHVADAGSTNGLRRRASRRRRRDDGRRRRRAGATASRCALGEGLRIVLSARAEGPAADYPSIALRGPGADATVAPSASTTPTTPIAGAAAAVPKTPLTAVLPRAAAPTAPQRDGDAGRRRAGASAACRGAALHGRPLARPTHRHRPSPRRRLRPARRRSTRSIANGAHGVVDGDNGIVIDGVPHGPGARFDWLPGQTMVLGGGLPGEPALRACAWRAMARTEMAGSARLITPIEPGRTARPGALATAASRPTRALYDDALRRLEAAVSIVVRQPARRQRGRAQRARRQRRACSSSPTASAAARWRRRRAGCSSPACTPRSMPPATSTARGSPRRCSPPIAASPPPSRASPIDRARRRSRCARRSTPPRRAGWSPGSAIAASIAGRRAAMPGARSSC